MPAVERLLQEPAIQEAAAGIPRPLVTGIIRSVIEAAREGLQSGTATSIESLIAEARSHLTAHRARRLQKVINATGIVVHTNLGRAPLGNRLFEQILPLLTGASTVEFDLQTGQRGSRGELAEEYLSLVAGAEQGIIVNNCAAGLFLSLNSIANRKEVIVSRGELVQIGGGFRIPDIMRQSGVKLREVGTTNITTIDDYRSAITPQTALLLKVHKSNFVQAGFSEEVSLEALVELGQSHDIPVMNDLGSGVFVSTRELLGYDEPTVQQSVAAGADITCFSGDKLLGGCQAGLLVGRKVLLSRIRKNPLFRTVRADKIVFAILEQLLAAYLDNRHNELVPLWQLLTVADSELYKRGRTIIDACGRPAGLVVEGTAAYLGGGALPEKRLSSAAIRCAPPPSPKKLAERFRQFDPPIIGRIEGDAFYLDLKAVRPEEDALLVRALSSLRPTS